MTSWGPGCSRQGHTVHLPLQGSERWSWVPATPVDEDTPKLGISSHGGCCGGPTQIPLQRMCPVLRLLGVWAAKGPRCPLPRMGFDLRNSPPSPLESFTSPEVTRHLDLHTPDQ